MAMAKIHLWVIFHQTNDSFAINANTHTCTQINISIMVHIFVHGIWCLLDQICMKVQSNVETKFPTSFHAPRNAVHPSEIQFH